MSMSNYPVFGTGFVLTGDLDPLMEKIGADDAYELADKLQGKCGDVYYYDENIAENICLQNLNLDYEYPEDAFVFFTDKMPSLFDRAYASSDELINEFKTKLEGLVEYDDDKEYGKRIGWFSCVIWA